jgi:hypothetical protein
VSAAYQLFPQTLPQNKASQTLAHQGWYRPVLEAAHVLAQAAKEVQYTCQAMPRCSGLAGNAQYLRAKKVALGLHMLNKVFKHSYIMHACNPDHKAGDKQASL